MATGTSDCTAVPSEADPAAEIFDVVDEAGNVLRQEARGVVHKEGLLHRAVYVFVFDNQGRLLIQKRSSAKKIGANQWDLSVAEHLSQGESYHEAASRGMQEELGITAEVPTQPLGPMHRRILVIPGQFTDNELVQSYRVDGFQGEVAFNPVEVSEAKFVELRDLAALVQAEPDQYTEWFRQELSLLNYFNTAEMN